MGNNKMLWNPVVCRECGYRTIVPTDKNECPCGNFFELIDERYSKLPLEQVRELYPDLQFFTIGDEE